MVGLTYHISKNLQLQFVFLEDFLTNPIRIGNKIAEFSKCEESDFTEKSYNYDLLPGFIVIVFYINWPAKWHCKFCFSFCTYFCKKLM